MEERSRQRYFTSIESTRRVVRLETRALYDGRRAFPGGAGSFRAALGRWLLYRAERLINWCPRCKTALADIEVVHEESDGNLWYIRYPLADDPSQSLIVATTRPETMLGDTAVAVHPEDERYQGFIGKKIRLPITD